VLPVGDDFGDAADVGGDDGDFGDHGFEESERRAFGVRGHHKEIGQAIKGLYVMVETGEGDTGGETGAGEGFGESGAFGAFADKEDVPGQMGMAGVKQGEGGDEVEVAFFAGEAADHEEDGEARGDERADLGDGGGIGGPGFDGVVEDGDAIGRKADTGELFFEGAADGDEVVGLAEAPAVEVVVEALFTAGGGVAVVKGDPGISSAKAA